ncbi:hypothetical protein PG984_016266 [Apiospora sp. TS-2023a]
MANLARPIPQVDWRRHEKTIKILFLGEGRQLGSINQKESVIGKMAEDHGFIATISQYEAQFRKWKVKKNRKSKDLAPLLRQFKHLCSRGKEARVISSGSALSRGRVERALRRLQETGDEPEPATSQSSQDYVEFVDDLGAWQRYTGPEPLPASPSLQLAIYRNRHHCSPGAVSGLDGGGLSRNGPLSDISTLGLSRGRSPRELERNTTMPIAVVDPLVVSPHMPMGTPLSLPAAYQTSRPDTRNWELTINNHESGNILSHLEMLLPVTSFTQPHETPLAKALVYWIANGLPSITGVTSESMLELLAMFPNAGDLLLGYLGPDAQSLSRSIAENLFRVSIEFGNAQAVDMILQAGIKYPDAAIDVNKFKFRETPLSEKTATFTPIEKAAQKGDIEVVKVLLAAGADPNKTHPPNDDNSGGALKFAVTPLGMKQSNILDLTRLLLESEAKLSYGVFQQVLHPRRYSPSEQHQTLQVFLGHLMTEQHWILLPKNNNSKDFSCILMDIVKFMENSTATSLVSDFLVGCDLAICGPCADRHTDMMFHLFCTAGQRRNMGLVQFLADHLCQHTPNYTKAMLQTMLSAAIRAGCSTLIDSMLNRGTPIDCPPLKKLVEPTLRIPDIGVHSIDTPLELSETTPLAEAILLQDDVLISRLESLGASQVAVMTTALSLPVLMAAAIAGNYTYIRLLLQEGPTIYPKYLEQAVSLAVQNQEHSYREITEMLLEAGAIPTVRTLSTAVSCREKDIVKKIIDYGLEVPPMAVSYNPRKLFVDAVGWGDIEIVDGIIDYGVQYFLGGESQISMLAKAAETGNLQMAKFLLDLGFDPNPLSERHFARWAGFSPLAAAILRGDKEMIELLMSRNAAVTNTPAFLIAMEYGNDIFDYLLSVFARKFPSGCITFGTTVLIRAIDSSRVDHIDKLLGVKMDVNTCSKWDIPDPTYSQGWAWYFEKHAIAPFDASGSLARFMARISPHDGNVSISALGFAISVAHESLNGLEIVRKLLEAGGNPDGCAAEPRRNNRRYSFRDYETPLLMAINKGNLPIVDLLLKAGATVNYPARRGFRSTPLQKACENGHLEIVELLLQQGADINAAPAPVGGGTAIQMAARSGILRIVQLLLDNGADIHQAPSPIDGRTAIQMAAERGRFGIIEWLWRQGDQSRFAERDLQRARKLAEAGGHNGCVMYLKLLINYLLPSVADFGTSALTYPDGQQE